jgi:hypothetical protein
MENNKPAEITPEENSQTIFSGDEFSIQGYDKHIRQARNALFIAAGILLLNAIIIFSQYPFDIEIMWLDYLLWIIYIGGFIALGLWTKKKPYFAIIGGLILMGLFILINAIIDPKTIISGIIFKIAVIVFLFKGMKDAKAAQEMKEQLEQK